MPLSSVAITGALIALVASTTAAQQSTLHRTPVLDLTIAGHKVSGGLIDFRTGPSLDVLAAGAVRSTPRWAIVGALGAGFEFGGFGDRCLVRPTGGCAPKGNFVVTNLLGGVDLPIGGASARMLLGPAIYNGAGDTSLGLQTRLDLSSPTLAHLGLGAMLRATMLPSHGGESLVAWAVGGSLIIRS